MVVVNFLQKNVELPGKITISREGCERAPFCQNFQGFTLGQRRKFSWEEGQIPYGYYCITIHRKGRIPTMDCCLFEMKCYSLWVCACIRMKKDVTCVSDEIYSFNFWEPHGSKPFHSFVHSLLYFIHHKSRFNKMIPRRGRRRCSQTHPPVQKLLKCFILRMDPQFPRK